jgi:CheY-like chemotaxis protein
MPFAGDPTSDVASGAVPPRLHALLLEDCPEDADAVRQHLRWSGLNMQITDVGTEQGPNTERAFRTALRAIPPPDVILADHHMPPFGAVEALALLRQESIDIPLIVMTGALTDDRAAALLEAGAADYLLKDRLARLAPAIVRVIEERRLTRAVQAATAQARGQKEQIDQLHQFRDSVERKRNTRDCDERERLLFGCAQAVIVDARPTAEEGRRVAVFFGSGMNKSLAHLFFRQDLLTEQRSLLLLGGGIDVTRPYELLHQPGSNLYFIRQSTAPPKYAREEERLAALYRYGILDTEYEQSLDDITHLAADLCEAPICVINFIDRDRQWFKSAVGMGAVRETPLDISICAHAILQPGVMVVPDTLKDRRFCHNPLVTGEPHLRFYAGALLESSDGYPLGTLCVLDYKPRHDGLTELQTRTLRVLADQVMTQLELRLLAPKQTANKAAEAKAEAVEGEVRSTEGKLHTGQDFDERTGRGSDGGMRRP